MKPGPVPWRLVAALALSVAGHAGAGTLLAGLAFAPVLDLEFVVPAEIELGSDDALALDLAGAEATTEDEPPPIEPAPSPAPEPEASAAPAIPLDLGPPDLGPPDMGPPDMAAPDLGPPDLGPPDMGPPDMGPPDMAAPDLGAPDAGDLGAGDLGGGDLGGESDAGADGGPAEDAGAGGDDEGDEARPAVAGRRAIPPGAQLAIRLDLARLQAGPLAEPVRELLAALPDWRALLEGSGIDPLTDLDRLLIATPSLRRSQMVLAGRHTHAEGPSYVRDVTARFGAARGVATPWSREAGVAVAPWPNPDRTPRVIAITGPRHFVISRRVDLPRLLAIAQARAARSADADGAGDGPGENGTGDGAGDGDREAPSAGDEVDDTDALQDASGADALLATGPREVFRIDAEGIGNFVRGGAAARAPQSMRLAFRDRGEGGLRLVGEAVYADAEAAELGVAFWEDQRRRLLANAFARIAMGGTVSRVIRGLDVGPARGRRVPLRADLTLAQARLVLSRVTRFVEGAARASRRPSTTAPTTTAPTAPATTAPAEPDAPDTSTEANGAGSAPATTGSAPATPASATPASAAPVSAAPGDAAPAHGAAGDAAPASRASAPGPEGTR